MIRKGDFYYLGASNTPILIEVLEVNSYRVIYRKLYDGSEAFAPLSTFESLVKSATKTQEKEIIRIQKSDLPEETKNWIIAHIRAVIDEKRILSDSEEQELDYETWASNLGASLGKKLGWDINGAFVACVGLLEDVNAHTEAGLLARMFAIIENVDLIERGLFYKSISDTISQFENKE